MPISKRFSIVAAIASAALTLSACGGEAASEPAGSSSGEAQEADVVSVQLDYQVRGNHGMFYVAQEKGFFADEGIEVDEIKTGSGSPDTLRMVGTGSAEFGFADLPSLATARSQNVPVKALAAVNQTTPLSLCSIAEKHTLSSLEDLSGLTMGVHTAGSTYIFYQALLALNDFDRTQVEEVTVSPPYENYLLQDQVDAVVCYIDAEVPLLEDAAGGEGSLSILLGSENGYDAYGSGLFTTDEMIEKDPDLVQRFTNAYLRAFEFVNENPDETAEILAKAAPELAEKADLFTRQIQADIDHTFTSPTTEEKGLGAMTDEMWQSTIDILSGQGGIKGEPPATGDVYDSTFVDTYHSENQD